MTRIIGLLLALTTPLSALAAGAVDDADPAFVIGRRAYEAGRYEEATRLLNEVMAHEPACAPCAHLLGRSYGRLAERARGLHALGLARKTRDALELAVQLDPENPGAIEDLIRYYRAAPGFLGGSPEKALELEQRLLVFDTHSST